MPPRDYTGPILVGLRASRWRAGSGLGASLPLVRLLLRADAGAVKQCQPRRSEGGSLEPDEERIISVDQLPYDPLAEHLKEVLAETARYRFAGDDNVHRITPSDPTG